MIDLTNIKIVEDDQLRDYQREHKEDIYKLWQKHNSIMLQMPTGTGKTRLFASLVKDLHNTGAHKKIPINVLILAHRKELIEQISENIGHKYGVAHGRIMPGYLKQEKIPTQIASVQTLQRRLEKWENKRFDVIIIDEAHHATAETYKKICKTFPSAKILGVTATPYRMNGKGFTEIFEKLIVSKSVNDFIETGYLCDYEYYSIPTSSDIQNSINNITEFDIDGDYAEKALTSLFNNNKIRAKLLKSYQKYASGKKGIIYTINKSHNEHVCKMYCDAGIKAKAIDSDTQPDLRKKIVELFRKGEIQVLCNVNIFSEGFDCPDVEFIQLARPTKSLAMYLQQVGRGFRKHEGKEKVIFLDNVGLYNRFGLPSSKRKWHKHFVGKSKNIEEELEIKKNEKMVHSIEDFEEGDEIVTQIYPKGYDEVCDFPVFLIDDSNKEKRIGDPLISLVLGFPFEYEQIIESLGYEEGTDDLKDILSNTYPMFKHLSNLRKGRLENKWGLFDNERKNLIFSDLFDEILRPDILGRALVKNNEKYGIIDCVNGKKILSCNYDSIEKIYDYPYINSYIVKQNENYGIVSIEDVIKITIEFEFIIVKGYINALLNEYWYTFDQEFNLIPRNLLLKGMIFGKYHEVSYNKVIGFADIKNNIVFPLVFSSIIQINEKFLIAKVKYGGAGVIDHEFDWTIKPVYSDIKFINNQMIKVQDESKWGILKLDGTIILPCIYEDCDVYENAFIVKENKLYKVVFDGIEIFSDAKKKNVFEWLKLQPKPMFTNKPKSNGFSKLEVVEKDLQKGNSDVNIDESKKQTPQKAKNNETVNKSKQQSESSHDTVAIQNYRLSKVINELGVPIERIVKILKNKGYPASMNPNSKITRKQYLLVKEVLMK